MHRFFKQSVFIPAAALAVSAAALAAPQAAYASSGGGCSSWGGSFPGTNPPVKAETCIENVGNTVFAWVYWTNVQNITCWGSYKVRDDTLGTFREFNINDCGTSQVSFTGVSGHHYHVYSNTNEVIVGVLDYPELQWPGTLPNSPELNL
jgi:hypothetical protein